MSPYTALLAIFYLILSHEIHYLRQLRGSTSGATAQFRVERSNIFVCPKNQQVSRIRGISHSLSPFFTDQEIKRLLEEFEKYNGGRAYMHGTDEHSAHNCVKKVQFAKGDPTTTVCSALIMVKW